ncbi:hypothetical protein BBK36DRAFT_1173612 [Trichoderma citrinoviride]|uniref:Zn(2)-C6 fungal-type domain-containing protein n=1 Tax=Trichoderma citrinoviride TaxID=58853 RepID=A0A2T4BLV0_9HYPO|nr:hypothetical protein BBK36DRAFT_1173612 [Trichoderma citrinoviride]PTB70239.1 hypothetical protein BBK36DRAFT_1173612 [Trichoderma citrinoviride]
MRPVPADGLATCRCQTCLRLGLECVQFDIFCPINVVTPTRDTRSSRSVSDADPEPDADDLNHSSPASTSSGSSGSSADDAESSTSRELVPVKARRLSRSSTQSQPELQFQTQFQLVHPNRSRRRSNRDNQDHQAVALRARGASREIPSLSEFSYLSTSEYFYLQYYLERLSNVLVNANSRVNPLKSLILPRIASSSLLLDAICATAAVHRSSASEVDRSEYATMATRYYVRVLSAVRELIPRVSSSSSGSGSVSGRTRDLLTDGDASIPMDDGDDIAGDDDGSSSSKGKGKGKAKNKRNTAIADKDTAEMAILASIFLCKYEIIKDGVENWRFHLRGIESLCQSLDADQAASMSETLTYVRSFMSYHKNIARVTESSPQAVDDEFEHEPFEQDRLFPVDPYMGFSQSLIILLGRVNDLLVINVRDEPEKLEQGIRELLRLLSLRSWDAHRFAIPEGMSASTIENSSHIAEAYRCAVIACIHAVLELQAEREAEREAKRERNGAFQAQAASQAQAQPMMSINWVYLHALLPTTKADALTKCLAAVARVPLGCPEEAGLLPLLFIVACETNRPDQAREALQRVEALGSHIGLGNVKCASALLNQVWKRRSEQGNFSDWRGLLAMAKWDLIIT